MNAPRAVKVTREEGEAALDGFRAACADGVVDQHEMRAHEARLVDLVARLRAVDAFDALQRSMGRATSEQTIRRLTDAALIAAAEWPDQAA